MDDSGAGNGGGLQRQRSVGKLHRVYMVGAHMKWAVRELHSGTTLGFVCRCDVQSPSKCFRDDP